MGRNFCCSISLIQTLSGQPSFLVQPCNPLESLVIFFNLYPCQHSDILSSLMHPLLLQSRR